ncbi:hypothetical protein AAMO2058_001730900, partial [Amorphochlora amoebiformis]
MLILTSSTVVDIYIYIYVYRIIYKDTNSHQMHVRYATDTAWHKQAAGTRLLVHKCGYIYIYTLAMDQD